MCVFCAAIPVTLTVGLAVDRNLQNSKKKFHIGWLQRPVLLLTGLLVIGLFLGSIYVHSRPIQW